MKFAFLLVVVILIAIVKKSQCEDRSGDPCGEYAGISGTVVKSAVVNCGQDCGQGTVVACCHKECPVCGTVNCRNQKSIVTGKPMGHVKCCSKWIATLQLDCGPWTNKKGKAKTRRAPCILPSD